MDKAIQNSQLVAETHVPAHFDFFGLGKVKHGIKILSPGVIGRWPLFVGFRLTGDDTGTCLVAFENLPCGDESMAVEMANILVAKFAMDMTKKSGVLFEVSPPETFTNGKGNYRHLANALTNATDFEPAPWYYDFIDIKRRKTSIAMLYLPGQFGGA